MNLEEVFLGRLAIAQKEFVAFVIQPPWHFCLSQNTGDASVNIESLGIEIHCSYPTQWRMLEIAPININSCLSPILIHYAHVGAHDVSSDISIRKDTTFEFFPLFNICVWMSCSASCTENEWAAARELIGMFSSCLENAILYGRRG